jgi:hypothetical protein
MGRHLATKYQRRARSVRGQTHRLRGDVAHVLVDELQNALQDQLYNRSQLPVSRAMMRSIRPIMEGNNSVAVGFNSQIAPHAPFRINMHGISVTGGHLLDLRLSDALRRRADPRIRRLTRAAQRRMLEAK